jgi:hypothetical protein
MEMGYSSNIVSAIFFMYNNSVDSKNLFRKFAVFA